jgi:hypothetical protein
MRVAVAVLDGTSVAVRVGVIEGVGVSVGGTGEGVIVAVDVLVAVTVGVSVGRATRVLNTAPKLPNPMIATTPIKDTAAPNVYPNKVSGRHPRTARVRAAKSTDQER